MHRGRSRAGPEKLLERAAELGQIGDVIARAISGEGGALLLEGQPGIGKTALLEVARRLGCDRDMTVLSARGHELETNFAFGVVRQLFEAVVHRCDEQQRGQLLAGPAELAAPIFGTGETADGDGDGLGQIHGLYWLTINLVGRGPLLIVVDDLHWADARSVRFLLYLLARMAELPLALIGAARPPAAPEDRDLRNRLSSEPALVVSRPAALSPEAVGRLLAARLDRAPDAEFAAACAVATGGVPFLVLELATALAADGVEPSAAQVGAIEALGPESIARATIVRLARMPAGSLPLARAIAVLGRDATLPRARLLAELDEPAALEALDSLVGASVVQVNGHLEFVHPILRRAVYSELPPGTRSQLHRAAATLLSAEGAELEAIAAQLVASEPIGSPETVDQLRRAARAALTRGGPEAAIAYLERGLGEGAGSESRAVVSFELANAERLVGRPAMVEHFRDAQRSAGDPVLRNLAALQLASALALRGERDEPVAVVRRALEDLGDAAPELTVRLECFGAAMAATDPALTAEFDARLPALRGFVERGGPAARSLALLLAAVFAWRGHDAVEVAALVRRGWDGGGALEDGADLWAVGQALGALIVTDQLDQAGQLIAVLMADAQARGSLARLGLGSAYRGLLDARHGALAAAEAVLRAAIDPLRNQRGTFATATYLGFATDVMLERPDAADLTALVQAVELGALAGLHTGAMLLEARGRLRHAAGDAPAAIDDMRRAGAVFSALDQRNPNATSWRSGLALMLPPGERDDALALARDELDDARRMGYPRALGIALRAVGLLEGGTSGRPLLEEAVSVLEASGAQLELARALVALGSARRRAGERAACRAPLRTALDIATEAGAVRLAEQARGELESSGAHPRRERITGRDALTPSELRVARLAAEGRTNNEVAQALFVTPKTVDTHLSHVYSKLGISSRRDLEQALGTPATR
jgi:DNA-binding CsgD family transcriptional regulator